MSDFNRVPVRPGVVRVEAKNDPSIYVVEHTCMDCTCDEPPIFMLRDHIWHEVFEENLAGLICLECFEKRLGRPMHPAMFVPDLPCNQPFLLGFTRGMGMLG